MLKSMTGFASGQGSYDSYDWSWELRSVNGKGLDIRLRMPDWIEGLEAAIRARLTKAVSRGNVTVSLKLQAREEAGAVTVNAAVLSRLLDAVADTEALAMDKGVSLAPSRATDLLSMRGVLEMGAAETDTKPLLSALLTSFDTATAEFVAMRTAEGAAVGRVLDDQITQIAALTQDAAAAAEKRRPETAAAFRAALERITLNTEGVDEQRIAQELAVLSVKADVTEELDRLTAHVDAARDLMAAGSPVGRKLDFLMQEFNREANTLCSKSQSKDLTAIGLDLKSVIDQLREQVQNIE